MTRIYVLLSGLIMSATLLEAAVYKGQKIYIKKCRLCHQGGEKIAAKRTMKEWEKYFKPSSSNLVGAHIGSRKVADQIAALHAQGKEKGLTQERLEAYLSSGAFKKNSKHLKDFMVEYAKDSGNVPACN